jgi:hypothetical protein
MEAPFILSFFITLLVKVFFSQNTVSPEYKFFYALFFAKTPIVAVFEDRYMITGVSRE